MIDILPPPPINAHGTFTFYPPFDAKLSSGISYIVRSARTFNEISEAGDDAYRTYYEPEGLDRLKYDEDYARGVSIVGLESSDDIWYYIPSSYIKSYPYTAGIPYQSITVTMKLGAIPTSEDLSVFYDAIGDLALNMLGVDPSIIPVTTSAIALVSEEKHLIKEHKRDAKRSSSKTCAMRYRWAISQLDVMSNRVTQLENFILENLSKCYDVEGCHDELTLAVIEHDKIDGRLTPEEKLLSSKGRSDLVRKASDRSLFVPSVVKDIEDALIEDGLSDFGLSAEDKKVRSKGRKASSDMIINPVTGELIWAGSSGDSSSGGTGGGPGTGGSSGGTGGSATTSILDSGSALDAWFYKKLGLKKLVASE